MDYRKVVGFGKSSLIVSLPKRWVDLHDVKQGDSLGIEQLEEGLLILPRGKTNRVDRDLSITVDIDGLSKGQIKREIIRYYINDYNRLNLIGKDILSQTNAIRKMLSDMVAFELIEQSKNKIIIKDFLDMNSLSLLNLVKKIDMVLRAMFIDFKPEIDEEGALNISERDRDINKLTYLIFRTVKFIQNHPGLSTDVDGIELMKYWVLTDKIETIADQVKRIARLFISMKLTKKKKECLFEKFQLLHKRYLSTLKAFYNMDVQLAYQLSDGKKDAFKNLETLFLELKPEPTTISIYEKLKELLTNLNDISKLVYN